MRKITSVLLFLTVMLCALGMLASCMNEEEYYKKSETDSLVEDLRNELASKTAENETAIETLKKEYEEKLTALESADAENKTAMDDLTAAYSAKLEELETANKDNAAALNALKAQYESELTALKAEDESNKTTIESMTAAYNEKVKELEKADEDNTAALNALKAQYESELTALKAEDESNKTTIESMTAAYNEKVKELEKADEDNTAALDALKAQYETELAVLKSKDNEITADIETAKTTFASRLSALDEKYSAEVNAINELIAKIENVGEADPDEIKALTEEVDALKAALQTLSSKKVIVSAELNNKGELVIIYSDGTTEIKVQEHHWTCAYTLQSASCTSTGADMYTCDDCGLSRLVISEKLPHDYTSVVTAPTCTAQGYTTYTCTECEDTYIDDITAKLPHDYASTVTAPTCTAEGYTTHICTICKDKFTDSVTAKLPHSYVSVVTEPTCTAEGYTTYTCTECKDTYIGDVTAKLPHSYSTVVTEPTCTAEGYTTYTCTECEDTYIDDITAKLPHDYASTVTAPTCTAEGYTTHICTICKDKFTDSVTAKLPHSYVSVVTEPICISRGYTTHECTSCGDTYVDSYVEPLCGNPDFVDGVCSICGTDIGDVCIGRYDVSERSDGSITAYVMSRGSDYDLYLLGNGKIKDYDPDSDPVPFCEYSSKIKRVYISDSITGIGAGTFYGCVAMTSLTIPDGVTEIGDHAFDGCGALTNISIPSGVKKICSGTFYGCVALTSVAIPDGVTEIGESAFYGCSGISAMTIGSNVRYVGRNAFDGCTKLSDISILSDNVCISSYAFAGTAHYQDGANTKNGIYYVDGYVVEVKDTVQGTCALPEGTRGIAGGAFGGCASVNDIVIPSSVKTIGENAFSGCTGLTSVTIPDSVTVIGAEVLYGCTSLRNITIPFIGVTADETDNGRLSYLFGLDETFPNSTVPASLRKVVVTGGKSIGPYAFTGCSGLTSITISSSVESIGNSAFLNCTGLRSIVIPHSVTSIASYAFAGCTNLTIYCEAASKPEGWDSWWDRYACPVVWDYIDFDSTDYPSICPYTVKYGVNASSCFGVDLYVLFLDEDLVVKNRGAGKCTVEGCEYYKIPNILTFTADDVSEKTATVYVKRSENGEIFTYDVTISLPEYFASALSNTYSGSATENLIVSAVNYCNEAYRICNGETYETYDSLITSHGAYLDTIDLMLAAEKTPSVSSTVAKKRDKYIRAYTVYYTNMNFRPILSFVVKNPSDERYIPASGNSEVTAETTAGTFVITITAFGGQTSQTIGCDMYTVKDSDGNDVSVLVPRVVDKAITAWDSEFTYTVYYFESGWSEITAKGGARGVKYSLAQYVKDCAGSESEDFARAMYAFCKAAKAYNANGDLAYCDK